ncbi:MAG: hypothetical protein IJD89_02745, partial [Clostridia bacterium]|nr:hypothetical protein [Clostridia bacterium]
IKNIEIKNCSFTEENPSLVIGDGNNLEGVKIENCSFKYEKGDTHPYYYGKIDLQPNMPELGVAPFKAGDLIYTEGADVTLNNEKINGSIK